MSILLVPINILLHNDHNYDSIRMIGEIII